MHIEAPVDVKSGSDFRGGLQLARHKALSNQSPIRQLEVPERLFLPLRARNGGEYRLALRTGVQVLRGTVLANGTSMLDPPLLAPTSGRLIDIIDRPLPYRHTPSGPTLVLESDGLDQSVDPLPALTLHPGDQARLLARLHATGVVGLGGAMFPAAAKLDACRQRLDTLIINGAECEPYLTCDDRLMQERADQVLMGLALLAGCLMPDRIIIGIESDMLQAWAAMADAVQRHGFRSLRLMALPTRYPVGGERQLIQTVTGLEVPSGVPPAQIGIVCLNVATVAAIYRAVSLGEALTSRIVTASGLGLCHPGNLEVRFGTPVSNVIAACGDYTIDQPRLWLGGPMMGHALATDAVPVIPSVHAVLAFSDHEHPLRPAPVPCIRCGECATVCPAGLAPQSLHWHLGAGQIDRAGGLNLMDCIECACCDVVCPSHLPLTAEFHAGKALLRERTLQHQRAQRAKARHGARQDRLAREQQAREEAAKLRKSELERASSPKIAEALARARHKRAGWAPPTPARPAPEAADPAAGPLERPLTGKDEY